MFETSGTTRKDLVANTFDHLGMPLTHPLSEGRHKRKSRFLQASVGSPKQASHDGFPAGGTWRVRRRQGDCIRIWLRNCTTTYRHLAS